MKEDIKELGNKQHEKMLFALLKYALNGKFEEKETPLFNNASDNDWMACFKLAKHQRVLGTAYDGIEILPETLKPERKIKIKWGYMVYQYENLFEKHCATIVKLEQLFQKNGIGMVVIKGVGISTYYPVPSHRRCGDIDIYTYSLDKDVMSDQEASQKSDEIIRGLGIKVKTEDYKHSAYYFDGIEIESHKYFLNIATIKEAVEIDRFLRTIINPTHVKVNDKYEIPVPSPEFNAVFIAFHASQHLGDVLSIYHIFDWACILKRYGYIMPEEIKDKGFLQFVDCITSLSNRLLNTNIETTGNEELESLILRDILYPPFKSAEEPKNFFKWFIYKTRWNLYSLRLKKKIYDMTLWRVTQDTIVFHWKKYFTKAE